MTDPKDEQIERLKEELIIERASSHRARSDALEKDRDKAWEDNDTLRAEVARLKEELAKETKSFTWLSKRRDEMQARIDSDERIFRAKDEDIATKDALITDARDEHKRLWAIIDARSSEVARLTTERDGANGAYQIMEARFNGREDAVTELKQKVSEQATQLVELRKDGERLDWLDLERGKHSDASGLKTWYFVSRIRNLRAALDAARKEKP